MLEDLVLSPAELRQSVSKLDGSAGNETVPGDHGSQHNGNLGDAVVTQDGGEALKAEMLRHEGTLSGKAS
jgi:hypothetical protein